ncbi:MAG TPA: glycogen debranching N-terminal domain-containing protein, partial [Candidatus Limnocylindrales bacterium]|nr:glycogen debranching N-terminal domain-containing protein [Candidatus Limnocylindrales bacterium]
MTTEAPAPVDTPLVLKHDRLRLITAASGAVGATWVASGLYAGDTRFVSTLDLLIDGSPPVAEPGRAGPAEWGDEDLIQLRSGAGPAVEFERRRRLGAALSESVALASAPGEAQRLTIRLRVGFDAADIFEVRGYPRMVRGELLPPRVLGRQVRLAYLGLDRRLRLLDLTVDPAPSRAIVAGLAGDGRELLATVEWDLELGSEEWPGLGRDAALIGWRLQPSEVKVAGRTAALGQLAGRAWASPGVQ